MSTQERELMFKLSTLIARAEALDAPVGKSFTLEELARLWQLSPEQAKSVIRKLRREGFLRRTRGGRYKLTTAGRVLVRIYRRVKKGE